MTKSRWAHWSRGTEDRVGFKSFMEAMDTGNPTGTGNVSPAERARQLGLQSDGSGGYIDPDSGQVVARTVNNELVFYDNRGATGGVVSDGAGGEQLANAQPSWSDPKTGMLTTPPAQPESPEELAAVPDATPAVAPMGYNDFMKKKKEQAYANPEPEEQEQPAEMGGGIPQMSGEIGMDGGGMMGEDYDNASLRKKIDLRNQINQQTRLQPAGAEKGGMGNVVDARAKVPKISGNDSANATDSDIKKSNKYFSDIQKAKDRQNVESEREFDNPAAEKAQGDVLDNKGFDMNDPEVIEFMQNARSSGDFQQALKKQRLARMRKEEDAKTEFNARERGTPQINNFEKDPNNKRNIPGKGTKDEREENGVLEALYTMMSTGQKIQNLDGSYNQDLLDVVEKHIPGSDKAKISALKTTRSIVEKLNSMGGFDPEEYAFGKDGGQSTDIPDRFRSNLYDDIMSDLSSEMAQFNPKYKTPSAKRGRNLEVNNGYNEKEMNDMGKELLKELYGYSDAAGGSLGDAMQSGDIYFNRRGTEEGIRGDIHKVAQMYRQMMDEEPDEIERTEEDVARLIEQNPELAGKIAAGKTPNQFKKDMPRHFMMEVKRQLGKRMKSGDLITQSLKSVDVPTDSKGKVQIEKAIKNPKIFDENSSLDDVYEFIDQDFDNPGVNLKFLERMSNEHPYFGTSSMGFGFPANMTGRWSDQGAPEDPNNPDGPKQGIDKKKYVNFLAQMRSDSDQFKIEPTYSGEDSSNIAARFGAAPLAYIAGEMKDNLGYDYNHMLPRGGTGGHKVDKKDKGKDQQPFTDEQREFWTNEMEDLMKPYEGSSALALDPNELQIGDSGVLEPKDYINRLINLANMDPDDIQSDENIFDRSDVDPAAKNYDKFQSRKRIQSTLKNLHLLRWLRNADMDRDEENPEGKLKKKFFEMLAKAGKLNTSVDDLSLPRWGIG